MEFFDIFIFNNVKSDLKIILFLPSQVVFKVKSVIFVTSIPIPKAPMGRGWADIHIGNGVFERFGFDELESRKFIDKSRTKQQRTPHAVYYIPLLLASDGFSFVVKRVYIYTNVGLSALLVSTCRAMREPQFVERVTALLHVFLFH